MIIKRKTSRNGASRKRRASGKRSQKRRTGAATGGQEKILWFSRHAWGRIGSLAMTFVVLGLLVLAWFAAELPSLDQLESYDKPVGIRVYDNANNLIGSYGHVVGKYIPYDDIPKHLIDALLATEDRRFFDHNGIDVWGILRAMAYNIAAGGVVQGGSTITQQLAKNTFLTPERTLKRKIQEVMLALWMESHFSKEKILEIYLNRVYLGAGNYGIDAASNHYFGKSATEMTLQESALLVGLLKAPSRYAPTRDRELSLKRTTQVILNMKDAGLLTERAATQAIGHLGDAISLKQEDGSGSRYFADWIVDSLPEYVGQVNEDMEVYTTLDPRLQLEAEETVTRYVDKEGKALDVSQASLLSMTPSGAIKAMVGGVSYAKSQFNRVTQAKRQPGSSFKFFVYLTALEWGLTPNSWVEDKPVSFGSYSPKNYDGRYLGPIPLREGFFRSINTIAVQLASMVGIDAVINMAHRLGIEEPLEPNLSLALGSSEVTLLEMVGAYAHVANGGRKVKPYGIRKIVLKKDNETLYERTGTEDDEGYVLRSNVVHMMNDLMTDTVAFGTGRGANFGRPAAGKTGTSQNSRDAWFIGFTPQYITGVWVGNDNNSPTKRVTGGALPARIWRDYMSYAHRGLPVMQIPQNFQYFEGTPMQGDVYGTGTGLPWRGDSGSNDNGSGFSFPWSRDTRRPDQPSYGTEANPRYEINGGAPVVRQPQPAPVTTAPDGTVLPTSQQPFPSPSEEQPSLMPMDAPPPPDPRTNQGNSGAVDSMTDWIKDKIRSGANEREYDYPAGGKKRRLFDD